MYLVSIYFSLNFDFYLKNFNPQVQLKRPDITLKYLPKGPIIFVMNEVVGIIQKSKRSIHNLSICKKLQTQYFLPQFPSQ